jgi:hypothetical protein
MYSGVPIIWRTSVKRVFSVSSAVVAFGDAEVDDLGDCFLAGFGDEDVAGLDVAVDDALLMRVLEGVADLSKEIEA